MLSHAGAVTLHADGSSTGSAASGVNPRDPVLTVAAGTAGGAVDEIAFYPTALTVPTTAVVAVGNITSTTAASTTRHARSDDAGTGV